MNLWTATWREGTAALEAFGIKATALPPIETLAAQTTAAHAATVKELALHVPTATDALEAQKEVLKEHEAQVKKDAAALAEWTKANEAVNAAMVPWQQTLATVDQGLQQDIAIALSSGASQKELATAWGLTDAQIKAVVISLSDYATALNATADLEKAEADQRKVIMAADLKATNDRVLAEFQKKQAAEASEAAFLKANLADAQAQDAIQQGVTTTTAVATESADVIGNAYTQHFKAAQGAFEQFQGVVVAGTAEMIAGLSSFHDAGSYVAQEVAMRDAQNQRGQFYIDTGIAGVPTRDSGGPVTAGKSYLIGGGKAPEVFTPGASGFVTPGAGGGGGVVQHIYVTQPLGTPDAIARAVADAQISLMKGQGARLPYGG
jgi:hypothetical protein